mgnify:CR=1 FL=1
MTAALVSSPSVTALSSRTVNVRVTVRFFRDVATVPTVYRGPYEYSVPGHEFDYYPQNVPEPTGPEPAAPEGGGGIQNVAVAQKEA